MYPVTAMLTLRAKTGKGDYVRFQLERLGKVSRREEGNLYYGVFQGDCDALLFQTFEHWSCPRWAKAHQESCHMLRFFQETQDALTAYRRHYYNILK